MDDREVVERQLGRPPRAFRRVVRRCPFGLPAVTEQDPYDGSGEPFPTTYYLTCPHAVAAVARLEAGGGVERWSAAAEREPELAASLERATELQRRLRRDLAAGRVGRDGGSSLELGIGGASRPLRLKCLHAHVAFALAQPGYELGERIATELEPLWPSECCSVASGAVASGVEIARREWEDAHAALERASRDRRRYERLLEQMEVVTVELRKRVGQTFTLRDLADAYADADRWSRDAVGEHAPAPGWPRDLALVQGAAFHLYARGALDYEP